MNRWASSIVLVLVVMLCLVGWSHWAYQDRLLRTPHLAPPAPTFERFERASRLRLRYSLIPGGVRSVEELRHAFDTDPALRVLLDGFNWDNAHIIRLTEASCFYATFRKDGKIGWTARPSLCLAEGEEVITDGVMFVRMACGNLISLWKHFPIDPSVPGSDLDRPEAPPVPTTTTLAIPPTYETDTPVSRLTNEPNAPVYPAWFGPVCCGGGATHPVTLPPTYEVPQPAPVVTPEPSPLALIGAALAGFGLVKIAQIVARSWEESR